MTSSPTPRAVRRLELGAILVALAALAAAVLWGRIQLRDQIRSQLMGRDASILQALAAREAAATGDPVDPDPAAQVGMLLGMADLTNLIAARLFDATGQFVAGVPTEVKEAALGEATLNQLRSLEPLTRFRPHAPRQELFLVLPDIDQPQADDLTWVEVYVPLHPPEGGALTGVAQFMMEGVTLEREFARLDRRLNLQSALVFGFGALVITAGLGWSFRRLARANALLAARTVDLQRANQALAEAARTTAVGAVTAHLIHSLKNPVAGLQSFVVARQDGGVGADSEEWREALAATRRMQGLIRQVVEVLRDQATEPGYTLPLAELAAAVTQQARPLATRRGVHLETTCESDATVDNRVAGLLRLILANLVQNALEATPPEGRVELRLRPSPAGIALEVSDTGGGIPERLRPHLFEPVQSAKEGGSGIGLAITRQLAGHLGATLSLVSSSPQGTVFRIDLPAAP